MSVPAASSSRPSSVAKCLNPSRETVAKQVGGACGSLLFGGAACGVAIGVIGTAALLGPGGLALLAIAALPMLIGGGGGALVGEVWYKNHELKQLNKGKDVLDGIIEKAAQEADYQWPTEHPSISQQDFYDVGAFGPKERTDLSSDLVSFLTSEEDKTCRSLANKIQELIKKHKPQQNQEPQQSQEA